MSSPAGWTIELNSFSRGIRLDQLLGSITIEITPAELIEISRRCLLVQWKEEGGHLIPQPRPEHELVPDEVVVRAPDGRALYRRTIIDEKIDRWFAEN
jgi:hypothetical protein